MPVPVQSNGLMAVERVESSLCPIKRLKEIKNKADSIVRYEPARAIVRRLRPGWPGFDKAQAACIYGTAADRACVQRTIAQ
jgi:hypothetical protein